MTYDEMIDCFDRKVTNVEKCDAALRRAEANARKVRLAFERALEGLPADVRAGVLEELRRRHPDSNLVPSRD